jgi:hypothetical protein
MRPHNTYSNTTTITIKISLRTTGEARKLKNRFHAGWLSFAFRLDLDPLLALATAYALEITGQKSILTGYWLLISEFFPLASTTTGMMTGRR